MVNNCSQMGRAFILLLFFFSLETKMGVFMVILHLR